MTDEIIKNQALELLRNLTQIKKEKIKLYDEKLNRMEQIRKRGSNTDFNDNLYQLTKVRYEGMKEVDMLLNQLWKQVS